MRRALLVAVSLGFLGSGASRALAQRVDLEEARRTVLEASGHQLSALESVMTKVPPHAQDKIAEALKANESSRNEALVALERAQKGQLSREEGVARAYEAVERGTRRHTEVLTDLLGKVPEEARPAIERAIEVSQNGRNTALANLVAIQQGQPPRGGPLGSSPGASVGRPSAPPKPEDAGVFSGSGRKADPPYGGSSGTFGRPTRPSGPGGILGGAGRGGLPGGPPRR
jgi:hypothetical protein